MPDTIQSSGQTPGIDPVDQAIITQALIAAAHEMGVKMIRSAHSTIVREAEDCSSAILDARGNVVAQSELIPLQLGSIAHTFGPCAASFPVEDLVEGDFYITNDPYQGGQHLPDVFLFSPIFVGGHLMGFAATVAHHIDLGGGAPGLNPDATDVHSRKASSSRHRSGIWTVTGATTARSSAWCARTSGCRTTQSATSKHSSRPTRSASSGCANSAPGTARTASKRQWMKC